MKEKKAESGTQQPSVRDCTYSFQVSSAADSLEIAPQRILVLDVGGSHVKMSCTAGGDARRFDSGPKLTPQEFAEDVIELTEGWSYDAISMGYPGPVLHGKPVSEPHNLGSGWVGFDFTKALGHPVRVINDAAMQAMGCYEGGKMLFIGLGTGMGSAMIVDGFVEAMELGHTPYKKKTYEYFLGKSGLKRFGEKQWHKAFEKIVDILMTGLEPDYVVIGGGNAKLLTEVPANCKLGKNADAFTGGLRLWGKEFNQT